MVYNSISEKKVKEISEISPKSCGLNHFYELIITKSDTVLFDDLLKVAVGERGIYGIIVYIGNSQPNKLDYIIAGLLGRRRIFLNYLFPKVEGEIHSYEELIEKDKDGGLIYNMRINVVGKDNNEDILIEKTVSGGYYINYKHLKLPSNEVDLQLGIENTLKCIEYNIEEYLKRAFGISEILSSYLSELNNFLSIRLHTELIGKRTSISPIIRYDKIRIEISFSDKERMEYYIYLFYNPSTESNKKESRTS